MGARIPPAPQLAALRALKAAGATSRQAAVSIAALGPIDLTANGWNRLKGGKLADKVTDPARGELWFVTADGVTAIGAADLAAAEQSEAA